MIVMIEVVQPFDKLLEKIRIEMNLKCKICEIVPSDNQRSTTCEFHLRYLGKAP